MDLIIVSLYTLCGNLLVQHGHQDNPKTKVLATEMMATV